jgi:YcxB-like protein
VTTTTADTQISFETQANRSEMIEARLLDTVARIRGGDVTLVVRWLVRPLAGALAGGFLFGPYLQRSYGFPVWASIICCAVVFAVMPGRRYGPPVRQTITTKGPSRYTAGSDGIREMTPPPDEYRVQTLGGSSLRYRSVLSSIGLSEEDGSRLFPWSAFRGYVESQRLIVLMFKPRAAIVIAKRCLSNIDAVRLTSIFSQNLRRI